MLQKFTFKKAVVKFGSKEVVSQTNVGFLVLFKINQNDRQK